MEGLVALDGEKYNVPGNKLKAEKMEKRSMVGGTPRKGLADISNLPHHNQDEKPQPISVNTKVYIDKLYQENMALVKLVADRNKIIELSAIELQKLRINYQKVQQQNQQLAQANSQMLVELNSGKDKLKALHHELGCKNALLQANKLVFEEKANMLRSQMDGNEVETIKCSEAAIFSQEQKGGNKPCHTKRKRQSKVQSLDAINVKPVQAKENAEKKRLSSRRQSARLKSGEEPIENLSEINNALNHTMVKPVQAEAKADKKRRSARFKSEGQNPIGDLFEINNALDPSMIQPIQDEEKADKKSPCARFKSGEQEPTEELLETRNALGPSVVKPEQVANKVEKERIGSRRQSARPKAQEQEPSKDLSQIDDVNLPVSALHDDLVHVSCLASSVLSVTNESEAANSGPRSEVQELRRSSVRPMRRAVEKVQSYKEIPINVKMRRPECY